MKSILSGLVSVCLRSPLTLHYSMGKGSTPTKLLEHAARDFFPFTLHACETAHYTGSPYEFCQTFLANKPQKLAWYAYDVTILSPTKVNFTVYTIRDNVYGGLGDKITEFQVAVPAELTAEPIARRINRLAEVTRERELKLAEDAIIQGYAKRLTNMVDKL